MKAIPPNLVNLVNSKSPHNSSCSDNWYLFPILGKCFLVGPQNTQADPREALKPKGVRQTHVNWDRSDKRG